MARQGLGRLAADFIASVLAFETSSDAARPQRQALKSQLRGLLDAFSKRAGDEGVAAQETGEACFFLVAWADERITHSDWIQRDEWERDSLQHQLYARTDGGEQFWVHLAALAPDHADAREVAFLCLANGFGGQFLDDPGRLQQATQHTFQMLRNARRVVELERRERLSAPAYDTQIDVPPPQGSGVAGRLLLMVLIGFLCFGGFWFALRLVGSGVPEAPV
jgi:type VI secretion system protein ImpK